MRHAVYHNNIEYINRFVGILDKKQLTSWSLIALLRSISTCKSDIYEWTDLLKFSTQKVASEGLNPKIELYGLEH